MRVAKRGRCDLLRGRRRSSRNRLRMLSQLSQEPARLNTSVFVFVTSIMGGWDETAGVCLIVSKITTKGAQHSPRAFLVVFVQYIYW